VVCDREFAGLAPFAAVLFFCGQCALLLSDDCGPAASTHAWPLQKEPRRVTPRYRT
jgi:hypothetical protein